MHRTALAIALCFELAAGKAPELVELIPAPDASGRVVGRDGRMWLWDAEARQSVINAFSERQVSLVIDRNHSTEHKAPQGEESPAAAWVEQLELRANGSLWGRVAWTPRGRDQVENLEYRYLSPVFTYDPESSRIARLVSAGLTNTPNLHLQALNQEQPMNLSAVIAAALGLAAGASEEQGLAAITKLKTDRDTALNAERPPSLDKFVPRADYDAVVARASNAEQQIKTADAVRFKSQVDAEIDTALKAGKITPASVDYHRASCSDQDGLERFRKFVGAAPVIGADTDLGKRKAEGGSTALNADEERVLQLTGIPREEFIKARDAREASRATATA